MKEPQIKLFGMKIIVPECVAECSCVSSEESDGGSSRDDEYSGVSDGKQRDRNEDQTTGDLSETTAQNEDKIPDAANESQHTNSLSELDDNSKTPSNEDDIMSENSQKAESELSSATNGQQKTLKKPDKILPCPRCSSMDTKFCYYNNYNVNQPRHFCRSCQRYWTAGGTMRNVPVGAGRRKNKNTTSHFHHITISAGNDAPNGFHQIKFKQSDTILSLNLDSPLCQSTASALCLAEKGVPNGARNEDYQVNNGSSISCKNGEHVVASPVGSADAISSAPAEGGKNQYTESVVHNINGFPCVPRIACPFPWNSAAALPAMYVPGYSLPYCPTPYWNYSLSNAWNVPWLSVPSSATNQTTGENQNSQLGKHSRNGELLKPNNSDRKGPNNAESHIVVPKTLRIDDPEEAAKSSIWKTLGIKYDSSSQECLFKAFQPKGNEKKHMSSISPLLQSNPAALARSLSFQETAFDLQASMYHSQLFAVQFLPMWHNKC